MPQKIFPFLFIHFNCGQVGIGFDLKGCLKYGFERLLVIGLKRLFNVLLEWLFNNHKVVLMIL
jgi:hypothetical protein